MQPVKNPILQHRIIVAQYWNPQQKKDAATSARRAAFETRSNPSVARLQPHSTNAWLQSSVHSPSLRIVCRSAGGTGVAFKHGADPAQKALC